MLEGEQPGLRRGWGEQANPARRYQAPAREVKNQEEPRTPNSERNFTNFVKFREKACRTCGPPAGLADWGFLFGTCQLRGALTASQYVNGESRSFSMTKKCSVYVTEIQRETLFSAACVSAPPPPTLRAALGFTESVRVHRSIGRVSVPRGTTSPRRHAYNPVAQTATCPPFLGMLARPVVQPVQREFLNSSILPIIGDLLQAGAATTLEGGN